jgi:O-antigen ligase
MIAALRIAPDGMNGWISREWHFWLCLTLWAFFPSSLSPWLEAGGLNYRAIDLLLFFVLGIPSLRLLLQSRSWIRPHLRTVLGGVLAILFWAAFSLFWSSLEPEAVLGMLYTLGSAAAAAALAYNLIQERSSEEVSDFLWRLSVFIAFTGTVYFAESFFGLGLRSAAAEEGDFGMARVRGPLFESSTGFFLLIPCLAYIIERVLQGKVAPITGVLLGFPVLGAILGLGSRAGLILLALFALFVAIFARGFTRAVLIVVLAVGAGTVGYFVFAKATTDRLTTLDPREGRLANHFTSWNVVASGGPSQWLFGAGYGALWPWYATEAKVSGGDLYSTGSYARVIPEGSLIYHSHSTYLVLLIELGLPGLLITLLFWRELIRHLFCSRERIFAAGLLVTAFALGFDLFLFRRPTRDVVWWIYLFGSFALCHPAVPTARQQLLQSSYRRPA